MKTLPQSVPGFAAPALLLAIVAGCTKLEAGTIPVVPENLRVPASQTLVLEARAAGVQIYECKPGKDDPSRYEFVLRAPEADLFDASGRRIGRHYAGPTWEISDGSKAVGEVTARADAADLNAIAWLLLNVNARSGDGVLGKAQSVQRLQTTGGKAPAQGCTVAQAGREVRIPYTAMYYFYAAGNVY